MNIQLDTVVKRVDLVPGGGGVRVIDSQGKLYQADKVCVCVWGGGEQGVCVWEGGRQGVCVGGWGGADKVCVWGGGEQGVCVWVVWGNPTC